MTAPSRLDPDALAALEEERDFLLRSLEDLEAEHAAGDIDEIDFHMLRDDYTRRAAEVMRGIEARRAAAAVTAPRDWRRVVAWILGLALLGGLSGVLLGRASGDRADGDTITGGARQSVVTRLSRAQSLLGEPDRWPEAIAAYESILAEQPSSVEAITYKAWLEYRMGEPADQPLVAWAEATRLDPGYPDAIVFQSIALADLARYDEAAELLDMLGDDLPPIVTSLVTGQGLRGRVYGEARYDRIVSLDVPTLADLAMDVATALEAANYLLSTGKDDVGVSALKLYEAVLLFDPDNAAALSRQALLLAQSSANAPQLFESAIELVDRAVDANPDNVEALVSRATLYQALDPAVACADLATVDEIEAGAASTSVTSGASAPLYEQARSLNATIGC